MRSKMEPVIAHDGCEIGWVSSTSDDKEFLKQIMLKDYKRLKKERDLRDKIRSGELPKPIPSKTYYISDRD